MDLPTAIEKYWAHATTAAAGVWLVVKAFLDRRDKERADDQAAKVEERRAKLDLAELTQEAVAGAVQLLREEVARLSDEVAVYRAELRALQQEHSRMIIDKDARIALLEAEKRQLQAENSALRRQMRDAGLSPAQSLAHFEVPAGGGAHLTPATEEIPP